LQFEYELPRLAVTATVNAGDFADQLEKAVKRSQIIEAKPMTNVSRENVSSEASGTKTLSNGKPPMQVSVQPPPMVPDRRFRRV